MDIGEHVGAVNRPEIFSVKVAEFTRSVDRYKSFVGREVESRPFEISESTQDVLDYLPDRHSRQIVEFCGGLSDDLMPELFERTENKPINTQSLRGLFVAIYEERDKSVMSDKDSELFRRLFMSLAESEVWFSNRATYKKEEVVEDFISSDDFDRDGLMNLAVDLLASTMPLAGQYANEELVQLDMFMNTFEVERQKVAPIFERYLNKLIPESDAELSSPIFVDEINRSGIVTNDEGINARGKYGGARAKAIAFWRQVVPGVNLSAISLAADYRIVPQEVAAAAIKSHLHETIHTTDNSRTETMNDYQSLINELITDGSAHIILAEAYSQDFTDTDAYKIRDGYISLVRFAQYLVGNNIVSAEEIVDCGIGQDFRKFEELLDVRVKALDTEATMELFERLMGHWGLIPPLTTDEREMEVAEFAQAPMKYFETKSQEMWKTVGNGYLGQKFYGLAIYERLRSKNPEWGEMDFEMMRDKEKGLMTDEAVAEFRQYFSEDQGKLRLGLLKSEALRQLAENVGKDEELSEQELANKVMGQMYRYKFDERVFGDEQKFEMVAVVAKGLKDLGRKVLKDNWGIEDEDRVGVFVKNVIPRLIPNNRQITFEDAGEVIEFVAAKLEGLTKVIDGEGGEVVKPSIEQVEYWAGALEYEIV